MKSGFVLNGAFADCACVRVVVFIKTLLIILKGEQLFCEFSVAQEASAWRLRRARPRPVGKDDVKLFFRE
jgi:hypothetical protein